MVVQKNNGLSEAKRSSRTILCVVLLTLSATGFALVFSSFENGMLISSFAIDIIMAIGFLLMKFIFPQDGRSIPVALTKLVGDFCAWQYYRLYVPVIDYIGIAVLIMNSVYLILSIKPVHRILLKTRHLNSIDCE